MMPSNELEVQVRKARDSELKTKPAPDQLGFGMHFTDHMFVMRWNRQHGWHGAEISPYHNFSLDPATMVLHYGQEIFEGLKAYRGDGDQIFLFRPLDNFNRMNESAVRMCMPRVAADKVLQALKALIYLDRDWIPRNQGGTLYLRPTMIATEAALGVRPSNEYLLYIIMSPVGAYYAEGFNPVKIYVSDSYVRAVRGGVGQAKTGGNYAASLMASMEAKKAGFTQVLWLDAVERRYVEEVGTSNIFFLLDDTLVTPALSGSILPGITRDSVLQLARDWGIPTVERPITIDEVCAAHADGRLREVFATGTAAVISPVGELFYRETGYPVNNGVTGPLALRFFEELQALQHGRRPDPHDWLVRVG